MSSDASADQLALARQHVESALGGILLAVDAVPQAWAAVNGAGEKYARKYARMDGATERMQAVVAQMQDDINNLTADEAAERSGTA